jgi:enamine deaminase RidA (YjgF/YER057c/UK114 family)
MTRHEIHNPDDLAPPRGYAHAVIAARDTRHVAIAGQIGSDAGGKVTDPGSLPAQLDRTLANILVAVRAAGGEPEDVTRMRIYVTDVDAYRAASRELGAVWRRHFGRFYPAMTLVGVAALVDPQALIEIDADAYVPEARP